jgi:hypothetical protein
MAEAVFSNTVAGAGSRGERARGAREERQKNAYSKVPRKLLQRKIA